MNSRVAIYASQASDSLTLLSTLGLRKVSESDTWLAKIPGVDKKALFYLHEKQKKNHNNNI